MNKVVASRAQETTESQSGQHEVCGWTGASATRTVAEVSAAAKVGAPKREVSQVTLSAIGDVSVATSEVLRQVSSGPQKTVWKSVILFSIMVYALSVLIARPLADASSHWVRALLIPAFPVLLAGGVFWWRQRWKFRARHRQFELKVWQEALETVGYEVANCVNAIRANIMGFRLSNREVNNADHLGVIEEGVDRMDRVLQKAQDPVSWWEQKKKKPASTEPVNVGEDTRSRIAL